jgi:glycine/D-amino acid oxidase-like deaminating enzyme
MSLWLRQALEGVSTRCPPLSRQRHADVAIVGGGYVGLWTAIELKEREPGIDVVVLEQDICGSGASGRNGGYVLSWWPKAVSLTRRWGPEVARDLIQRSDRAIDDVATFCEEEGLQVELKRCGWVWGAESNYYSGAWIPAVERCRELGVGDFEYLDRDKVAALSGTRLFVSGVLDRTAALLHPGRLARGMREAAIRRGVAIYEQSGVRRFTRGRPVQLDTAQGSVIADKVVLATNAWSASIRELARSIIVVSSDMIASQPMPELLEQIGWRDGAGVNGSQTMVDYVRTTLDGRLLAGKGGLASAYGGWVSERLLRSPRRAAIVLANLRVLYPHIADLVIDCHWSGPVDRSCDGLPLLGSFPGHQHILYGIGWSGNGLGPSRIGGRVLASLALQTRDEWASLPLIGDPRRDFPGEPWRFLGGHVVRSAVRRNDRAKSQNRRAGRLVSAIAALAPRGVED